MAGSFHNHGLQDISPDGCEDAVVDIVFLHGLHGDSEATWTATRADGMKIFWPQDLLPEDTKKQARILTWGYDSFITHFWTKSAVGNVDTHARNLCADLSGLREKEPKTVDRPIIFIAHSMGGIVVANALILAQNSAEEYANKVAKHVRGIIFLGTPHEGADKTKWAEAGRRFVEFFKKTNPEPVEILDKTSLKLKDIGSAFLQLLRQRGESDDPSSKISVVCFWEERPTAIGIIVPEESATLGAYDKLSIYADHVTMCKFATSKDQGYQRVKSSVTRLITKLEEEAKQEKAQAQSTGNKVANIHGDRNRGFQTAFMEVAKGGAVNQTANSYESNTPPS